MVKGEKGQALVEFALVLPLMLILFCGVIDFGRIIYANLNLNMVSQEGVRMAGLGESDQNVIQFTEDKFKAGDSSKLIINISPNDTIRDSGDYVSVSLEYPISYATPLISSLLPSPYIVNVSSTIRVE